MANDRQASGRLSLGFARYAVSSGDADNYTFCARDAGMFNRTVGHLAVNTYVCSI